MHILRSLYTWAIAAAIVFSLGVWALAQTGLTSRTLTGNEAWPVGIGGPQGPSIFVTTAQIRNSQGPTTTASTSGTLSTLTTSTASLVFTAASVSTTVNLPATPYDGEIFEVINGSGGAFTQCTVAATDGSTIVNGATTGALAAGASAEWRYVLSTTSWYRMR